jgi:transposase-like protein
MKLLPVFEKVFRRHKRSVGKSWRMNAERETPIKIRQRKYLNNIVEQDTGRSRAGLDLCWDSRSSVVPASY